MTRVLLVDDSKTQLDIMKMRFEKNDFEVEFANNALDGYKKVFSFAPDVILSDIIMPELDGYQFCRLLKNNKLTKHIPVILLTVLDKNLDKFWGKKAGADLFISKTADFEEIKEKALELVSCTKLTDEEKEEILKQTLSDISVKEQLNNILNELLMQSTFLNEFRNLGEFYTHEKVLVDKTFDLFSSFIDYDIAGIFFNCQSSNSMNMLYLDSNNAYLSPFVIEKIKRDFFAKMPGLKPFNQSEFKHEIVKECSSETENKIMAISALKSSTIIPLMFEGKLIGGVCFFSKADIDYEQFKFHSFLKSELLALFKMKSLYSEVEFLSVTDGLTGLYNRRHFEYNIEREFLRAKRYQNDLSLAILDIDFFKSVNDTYGHQYGDYVLKEVSELMKESFRKTDMIYRYGGEELTVILTETSKENAKIPVERLREKIANHEFIYSGVKISLTVSVGIGGMDETYSGVSEFVECADKALYNAKQTGRNKVVVYNE